MRTGCARAFSGAHAGTAGDIRSAGAPAAASGATAKPAAEQPKTGGSCALRKQPTRSASTATASPGGGSETAWLVFDRLTTYDQNRTPQPMLAESWDISSDYKSFKLNLRKGVQFHSGREMTSDDVKYTILRLRESTVGSGILAGFSNWFSTIDTPDKYTVMLKTDASRPTFFDAIELFNIVDKENVEGPEAKSKIIGTGPFTFVEWQNGDHFTVAKNKNYWQSGRPYLDEIISYVRDQQTMDLQLESDGLDVVKIPNVDDFVRLKEDPTYQAVVHPASGTFFEVGFNTKRPPFDDKRVRQAFNYAMDRKRFAETIWRGTSTPLNLPWSSTSPAYDASKNGVYTYDLDKAKSLLQAGGRLRAGDGRPGQRYRRAAGAGVLADLPGQPGADRGQAEHSERRAGGVGRHADQQEAGLHRPVGRLRPDRPAVAQHPVPALAWLAAGQQSLELRRSDVDGPGQHVALRS